MENPIKTALCSFGMSGRLFHAPFVHLNLGFVLQGAWERTKKDIHNFYPETVSYDTYEELLDDENIELVIVNTPNVTHYDFVKKALLAGKHVVVEKPFTATVKEGEELIALAKEKNKVLSVYQNRRYDSDYRTVKKILDEKLLGDLVEAEIHYDRYVKELSYKAHKELAVQGTGCLYDLGSHLIDQALQLFGWPQSVFADIRIVRPASVVDDNFELILYYPELRVRLRATYLALEPIPGYVFHGTNGSFLKPKTNIQEASLLQKILPEGADWGMEDESEWGLLVTEKDGKIIKEKIPSLQGQYMDYYDGIYNAIRLGKPVPVDAEEGLGVIKIITAAFKSNEMGKVMGV